MWIRILLLSKLYEKTKNMRFFNFSESLTMVTHKLVAWKNKTEIR